MAKKTAKTKAKSTRTSKKKYVYFFGNGKAEGRADMKEILGGKGAGLAEMTNIGVPVPPGFTISTEVCKYYYDHGEKYPPELDEQVEKALRKLERTMNAELGNPKKPLLVSVRSGAAVSMPGMMDTVLNLGINEEVVQGLIEKTGNERFAWDAYRRFINMFGNVVFGVDGEKFEEILDEEKKAEGAATDADLSVEGLKKVVAKSKELFKKETGIDFIEDPKEQLQKAIDAVFGSWNNPRAIRYREINDIKGLLGTAVNVVAMVYGNMGDTSGTGVCFSRDPSTGKNQFYGEFLVNAQGEDVVAGIRTPVPIDAMKKGYYILQTKDEETGEIKEEKIELDPVFKKVYKELLDVRNKLEKHFKDMQDMEFTVQEGELYLLQTRTGKRTAQAAVKIAVDMVKEKLIDIETAVMRVQPDQLDQLLHPMFDPKAERKVIGKGLNASPGAAVGQVVFTAEEAEKWAKDGKKVILVRTETSPEDIGGMHVAEGILTARGGMTSHAAVVARGMGTPCVAGSGIIVDEKNKKFVCGDTEVKEGDWISIDGSTGEIMLGQVPTVEPKMTGDFGKLMRWVDDIRKMGVWTNADTPHDAEVARKFGAEGIGLCRTEHMFFEEDRIPAVREMILADSKEDREKALAKLEPMQTKDFYEIFKVMKGLPVTIRLLDPPLHEFLPHDEKGQKEMAEMMGLSLEEIKEKVKALSELNPMLGHRGCRLGITYPEVYDMQVRAIINAACKAKKERIKVHPEIMIPLIGTPQELEFLEKRVRAIAEELMAKNGVKLDYMVGTMIEIPRAALVADKIAETAEFFSFGTNDLTQMTFGYSRDDVGTFVPEYIKLGILESDPFATLDQEGVGQLVKVGIERGRSTRKDLQVGICGEHGGDPESVKFCYRVGMNYVSCSPFRVPIARLAAAHAVIEDKQAAKAAKAAAKSAGKKKATSKKKK